MKRNKTLVFTLLLLCGIGGGTFWVISSSPARGQSQDTSTSASSSDNSLGRLDAKAKAAQGGDEARIGELADEVLASLNVDQAPAGMADAIKERLVRAEANYRNGGKAVRNSTSFAPLTEWLRNLTSLTMRRQTSLRFEDLK
jgi:hypothetical protein